MDKEFLPLSDETRRAFLAWADLNLPYGDNQQDWKGIKHLRNASYSAWIAAHERLRSALNGVGKHE